MYSTDFDKEVTFEIKEHLAVLTTHCTGWRKELNVVSWNYGPDRLDIRDWHPDHEHMSRGIALSMKEGRVLLDALEKRFRKEE